MILNNMINNVINELRVLDRFRFDPRFHEHASAEDIKYVEDFLDSKLDAEKIFTYDISSAKYDTVIYALERVTDSTIDDSKTILHILGCRITNEGGYSTEFSMNVSLYSNTFEYIASIIEVTLEYFKKGYVLPVVSVKENNKNWLVACVDKNGPTRYITLDKDAWCFCFDQELMKELQMKNLTAKMIKDCDKLKASDEIISRIWRDLFI